MHQRFKNKVKTSAREDYSLIETIVKHSITIFEC